MCVCRCSFFLSLSLWPMYPPPLVLVAPAPICLLTVPIGVLGEALAPLHHRGIAESKLCLQSVCCVPAHAADIGCLLRAFTAEAPSLSVMFPLAFLEAKCLLLRMHLDGGNGNGDGGGGHLIRGGSSPLRTPS